MKTRISVLLALGLAGLALGCGSSDEKASEEAEHGTTPRQAIAQIGEVRSGLAQALATYKAGDATAADRQVGDATAADRQVGDAYLNHFELVEGPLGEVDHELTEQLEDAIREELRDQIRADAGTARIAALVKAIDAKLDQAEQALSKQ